MHAFVGRRELIGDDSTFKGLLSQIGNDFGVAADLSAPLRRQREE
jgi:hypothetical protein